MRDNTTTGTVPQYWYPQITPLRYGWICPKCNSGVSPDVQKCPCNCALYGTSTVSTTGGSAQLSK